MSPGEWEDDGAPLCFPRASGDEPWSQAWEGVKAMFSPRERG